MLAETEAPITTWESEGVTKKKKISKCVAATGQSRHGSGLKVHLCGHTCMSVHRDICNKNLHMSNHCSGLVWLLKLLLGASHAAREKRQGSEVFLSQCTSRVTPCSGISTIF